MQCAIRYLQLWHACQDYLLPSQALRKRTHLMHEEQLLTLLLLSSIPLAALVSLDETLQILRKDIKEQIT